MFTLYVNKNQLTVRKKEFITSGSVNVYTVRFEFSDAWNGLTQKAVFRGSGNTISVLLDADGKCNIPWETMTQKGGRLYAGVYGTLDDTVLPTIWADLGPILDGVVEGGNESPPPSPDVWEQLVQQSQETVDIARKLREEAEAGVFTGPQGERGPAGEGVPDGGAPGQVLTKTDAGTAWKDPTVGGAYEFGHGLKQDGIKVSVDMASGENPNKTLPISAAAVEAAVGNIEILLQTI